MSSADALKARALRSYEHGRLSRALLASAVIPPAASLAFLQCAQPAASVACSLALAVLVAAALHLGRDWGRGARAGLVAGLAPFALPPAIEWLGSPELCDRLPWFCAAGGVAAGVILLARRPGALRNPGNYWATAAAVTLLAGSIGCLVAGLAGLAGLAAGLAAGAVPVLIRRTA